MQTLQCLHEDAGYAHLDVTSVNIMWNPCVDNAWDSLRVLDFGCSLKCTSGMIGVRVSKLDFLEVRVLELSGEERSGARPATVACEGRSCCFLTLCPIVQQLEHVTDGKAPSQKLTPLNCDTGVKDAIPQAVTMEYAAPEVLRSSMQRYSEAAYSLREVDGPASDVYSAGAVLYQVVTGELPFDIIDADLSQIDVPDEVSDRSRERYRLTVAMVRLHTTWVSSSV